MKNLLCAVFLVASSVQSAELHSQDFNLAESAGSGMGNREFSVLPNLRSDTIHAYYRRVVHAFAVGDPTKITKLYDPEMTKPMTIKTIYEWAVDFFSQHGPAEFAIDNLAVEQHFNDSATTVLDYRVETSDGKGSFAGRERDQLSVLDGLWVITAWEALK